MKISSKIMILPALALMLAGCSQQPVPTETTPADQSSTTNTQTTDTTSVEMSNYKFSPTIINAKAGSTVTVKLTSKGGAHDFVIDELKVKSKMLGDGESQDVEIQIPSDASGKTFEYYCGVANHRQMGMVGKLMVE